MSKQSEHSFANVISINPYTGEFYVSVSNFLSKEDAPSYAKDQFAISYLNTRSFIHTQLAISKNIPNEDIYDALYSKAYDELALDQAIEYKIEVIEDFNNLDEENRYFHLFIVDPSEIQEIFKSVIGRINYIDIILPQPLLYKTLYTKEIIESSNVDCFLYIEEHDASLTIYKEKEFLYTKSLKFSFMEMHERFCEIHGERIEYEEFKSFLAEVNLKHTQSNKKESIIKLYKELFATVGDVITYAKRAYELDKIDKIYVGSSLYLESKIDEILEAEIAIRVETLEFDYGFETNEHYIDQLHPLMHLYTAIPEEERYPLNFSIFPRPPKFFQRESGKIIAVTAASLIIAFIYPITYWILAYAQDLQLALLKDKYNEIHNIRVTREATIKNKKADLEKVSALVAEEKKEFESKKATLIKIKNVKNNYIMKAKVLTTFTKELNKHRVKVQNIRYDETNATRTFQFDLVASKSIKITRLLKDLTKKYENIFTFDLEKIVYDPERRLYFSSLKAIKL